MRTNKFIVEEWRDSTERHPIVDARKFKRVNEKLFEPNPAQDRPSYDEYLGKIIPKSPHPVLTAPQIPTTPVAPTIQYELFILPVTQTGDPTDPDKLDFKHTTYGIKIVRNVAGISQSEELSSIYQTDHPWFTGT